MTHESALYQKPSVVDRRSVSPSTVSRKQIESRGLEKPIGLGRIYRVVCESKKPGPKPQLNKARSTELVKQLSHPNGWWRDTAQRLLVERADSAIAGDLKMLAISSPIGTRPQTIHRADSPVTHLAVGPEDLFYVSGSHVFRLAR